MRSAVVICLALAAMPAAAHAEDPDEGGRLYAVQDRKHTVAHELTLAVGIIPLDAFYKGLTGSFAYTYHFDDLWAWEIVNGTYSFSLNTALRRDLERNFGVMPTEFPELRILASTSAVVKPLYGKLAFLNDGLVYLEMLFDAGPAIAKYDNAGMFAGASVGAGLRVHLSSHFAARFDVRNYALLNASTGGDLRYELHLQAALSLNVH